MSMIFMSGWESGLNLDTWTSGSFGTGSGVSTSTRRGSQYAMLFTNSSDTCKKVFSTGKDELYAQFAVFWPAEPDSGSYLNFSDGTLVIASVGVSGCRLVLYKGLNPVAFSDVIFQPNCWYVIEVRFKHHVTDGVIQARVNGTVVCTFTGNTRLDSNCVSRWRFETGGALTYDSIGSNTLNNVDVVSHGSIYREGSYSADFNGSSAYLYLTDANLSSDFPVKSGKIGSEFTLLTWLYLDGTSTGYIIFKEDVWEIYLSTTYISCGFCDAINYGYVDVPTATLTITLASATWYHLAFRIYGKNSRVDLRAFNATSSAIITDSYTSTSSIKGYLRTKSTDFRVGSTSFDGKLDEMIIFNGLLSDNAIDSIRTGTYEGYTQQSVTAVSLVTPTSNDVYFDDVIVNDTSGSRNNSWPNQARISKLQAIGNGPTQQFTGPFSKNHWEIMQCYPSKTFFLSAGATGLTEILDIDSSPVLTTDILAVDAVAIARVEPISIATPAGISSFTFFLTSGATVYDASLSHSPTTSVAVYDYIWESSPISGLTWTTTELDSLYLGVKT